MIWPIVSISMRPYWICRGTPSMIILSVSVNEYVAFVDSVKCTHSMIWRLNGKRFHPRLVCIHVHDEYEAILFEEGDLTKQASKGPLQGPDATASLFCFQEMFSCFHELSYLMLSCFTASISSEFIVHTILAGHTQLIYVYFWSQHVSKNQPNTRSSRRSCSSSRKRTTLWMLRYWLSVQW